MNLLFQMLMGKPRAKASRVSAAPSPAKKMATAQAAKPTASRRKRQYDLLVKELSARYGINIKRWRRSTSGVAWTMRSRNGTITRWVEAPYPTGPVSCAVFLHEVGHHAIGLGVHKPRCLEEHLAWQWALRTMQERDLNITAGVTRRVERSMKYAVSKAVRRGLKRLPVELQQYL